MKKLTSFLFALCVTLFVSTGSAQSLICSFCPMPDTTWITATSHTNPANQVRMIGFSSMGLPGANALYLGLGSAATGFDATKYVVLDATEQVSVRIGTQNFGGFWGGAHVPMFYLSVPRFQMINTLTKNVLWFYEGLTAVDPVAHALIVRAQSISASAGSSNGRSGALVLEAGLISGAGNLVANDIRLNAGGKGVDFWGNVVFDEYTPAVDDTTDVPPVPANGMKGGLIMPPPAPAAPSGPIARRAMLYPDPITGDLWICQPTDTLCRRM